MAFRHALNCLIARPPPLSRGHVIGYQNVRRADMYNNVSTPPTYRGENDGTKNK